MSFKVSYRLNKRFSKPGKILDKGALKVSSRIIKAINEIINTHFLLQVS